MSEGQKVKDQGELWTLIFDGRFCHEITCKYYTGLCKKRKSSFISSLSNDRKCATFWMILPKITLVLRRQTVQITINNWLLPELHEKLPFLRETLFNLLTMISCVENGWELMFVLISDEQCNATQSLRLLYISFLHETFK